MKPTLKGGFRYKEDEDIEKDEKAIEALNRVDPDNPWLPFMRKMPEPEEIKGAAYKERMVIANKAWGKEELVEERPMKHLSMSGLRELYAEKEDEEGRKDSAEDYLRTFLITGATDGIGL